MANIASNESYINNGEAQIPKNLKYVKPYTPNNLYRNLANRAAGNPVSSVPGSPEAIQKNNYDTYLAGNSPFKYGEENVGTQEAPKIAPVIGFGTPTEQQFAPPSGDVNAPISLPSDYGQFKTVPKGTAQIRNIEGDVPGQYVEDTADPNNLIKTVRGENNLADEALRATRSGSMYQIDHIMPLSLGGADTAANRQLLTTLQNDAKTKAQSVAYTLYMHKEITLDEARKMAMHWKGLDTNNIPQPDGFGMIPDIKGNVIQNIFNKPKTGIEIARETVQRWKLPKEKTIAEKIGEIPANAKDFGKGWMPDPIREFTKGATTGLTMGFVPYEQGEDEGDDSFVAGRAGMVLGGILSFGVGLGELKLLSMSARGLLTGVKALKTTPEIVEGAAMVKEAMGLAEAATAIRRGIQMPTYWERVAGSNKFAHELKKGTGDIYDRMFGINSANKVVGGIKNFLTPQRVRTSVNMGLGSVIVSQQSQFIQNHLNPDIISGKAYETEQKDMFKSMAKEFAIGAITGVQAPTLSGTAYAVMIPTTLGILADPHHPENAIVDGLIFGAVHGISSAKNPNYNDVKAFKGTPYGHPALVEMYTKLNDLSEASLKYWAPESMKGFKRGESNEAVLAKAEAELTQNVYNFYKKNIPATGDVTLQDFESYSKGIDEDISFRDNKVIDIKKNASEEKTFISKALMKSKERADVKAAEELQKGKMSDIYKEITDKYGEGSQDRNTLGKDNIPEENIATLQIALQELKRGKIALRQLYKDGLSTEMHMKADLDDLFSFRNENLQARQKALFSVMNPKIADDALKVMQDPNIKFLNDDGINMNGNVYNAFEHESRPGAPDYKSVGIVTDPTNKNAVKSFIERHPSGTRMLAVLRDDWAPAVRMTDNLITKKDAMLGNYKKDPAAMNTYQVFGIERGYSPDGKQVQPYLVPLGMVSSQFHLSEARGIGHEARNLGKAGDSNPDPIKKNLRKEDFSKEDLAREYPGQRVIVLNMEPQSTGATLSTGNVWLTGSKNATTDAFTRQINEHLKKNNQESFEVKKPYENMNPDQRVADVKTEHTPITDVPQTVDNLNVPTTVANFRGTTDLSDSNTGSYSIDSIKKAFKDKFKLEINDQRAQEILDGKITISGLMEHVKMLSEAEPDNIGAKFAIAMREDNYNLVVNSGILEYNDSTVGMVDKPIVNPVRVAKRPVAVSSEEIKSFHEEQTNPIEITNDDLALESKISQAFGKSETSPIQDPVKSTNFQELYDKLTPEEQAAVDAAIPHSLKKTVETPVNSEVTSSVDLPVESKNRYDQLDEAAKTRNLTKDELAEFDVLSKSETKPQEEPIMRKMSRAESDAFAQDYNNTPMEKIKTIDPEKRRIITAFDSLRFNLSDFIDNFSGKASRDGYSDPNADAHILMSAIENSFPNKVNKKNQEAIVQKKQMVADLTQKAVHKISELHSMPLKKSQEIFDDINRIKYDESGNLIEKAVKTKKMPLFGKGEWDTPHQAALAIEDQAMFDKMSPEAQKVFMETPTGKDGKTAYQKLKDRRFFNEKDPITGLTPSEALSKAKFDSAQEMFTFAKKGMEIADPGSYAHSRSYQFDKWLSEKFGKNYANDPKVISLIGKAIRLPSYKSAMKKLGEISNESSLQKPFTKHKNILKAMAEGNRGKDIAIAAENIRREAEAFDKNIYKNDIADQVILETEGLRAPNAQDDYIEGSLGDFAFPALTNIIQGGAPESGTKAVRGGIEDARNTAQILLSAINEVLRTGGKETLYLTNEKGYTGTFSNLSKEKRAELDKKTNEYFDKEYKDYIEKYKIEEVKDGGGGPGTSGGNGGDHPEYLWGTIKNKMGWNPERYVAEGSNMNPDINSPLGSVLPDVAPEKIQDTVPQVTPAPAVKTPTMSTVSSSKPSLGVSTPAPAPTKGYVKGNVPGTYTVRGVTFNNMDLDEAADILYTEVGNRIANGNKRPFETRHIINTAINRALQAPSAQGKNIVAVLKKPYQYQGYAPNGSYSKGKIIESEYQRIKRGIYNKDKYDIIRQTLEELKNPDFKDTTGGATFYAHANDGTMWVGSTQEEVKKLVNDHEKRSGVKLTPWGTANGLPVKVAER